MIKKTICAIALGASAALGLAVAASLRRPGKVIYGCEGRGDDASPYLTRRTLLNLGPLGKVCLHTFHRSDANVFHDHPFPFVTVVLKGGYFDMTPAERRPGSTFIPSKAEWLGPGSVRYRPAHHTHRVSLVSRFTYAGRGIAFQPATTLVWLGPRVREWGFHLPEGWTPWRDYFR